MDKLVDKQTEIKNQVEKIKERSISQAKLLNLIGLVVAYEANRHVRV